MYVLVCLRYETGVNEVYIKDSYSECEQYAVAFSEHMEDIWWIIEPKKIKRIEFAMSITRESTYKLREELDPPINKTNKGECS